MRIAASPRRRPAGRCCVTLQAATAVAAAGRRVRARRSRMISAARRTPRRPRPRRTPVTEDELNSWFAYRAQPLLPDGRHATRRSRSSATARSRGAGHGRSRGGRRRRTVERRHARSVELLGGGAGDRHRHRCTRRTARAASSCRSADVSGVPVPKSLLQELCQLLLAHAPSIPRASASTIRSRCRRASGRSMSARARPSSFSRQCARASRTPR